MTGDSAWNEAPALHTAARDGDLAALRDALADCYDINCRDEGGWTALHWGAYHGYLDAVRLLLDAGADIDAEDESECTPLRRVCDTVHFEVARELIARGADVNKGGCTGWTPLHEAAGLSWSEERRQIAEALIEAGADVRAQSNDNRWTPLHVVADESIARMMAARGADIDARDAWGRTPLFILIGERPSENPIRALIELGADVQARDMAGWTPLHCAASWNNHLPDRACGVLRLLLEAGADANAAAHNKMTPLMVAALPSKAKLLLERGANAQARDRKGRTAAQFATKKQSPSVCFVFSPSQLPGEPKCPKDLLDWYNHRHAAALLATLQAHQS